MNFTEYDDFNELANTCQKISALPNTSSKLFGLPDDDELDDYNEEDTETIHMIGMPSDPETVASRSVINVYGKAIPQKKQPIFGDAYCTLEEAEELIEEGCGIKNALKAGLQLQESLGYESPYKVGDFIKLNKEDMPHIYIIISTDGSDLELAKPTANQNEYRVIGGGVWPRCRCEYEDISHKVDLPIYRIKEIIQSNDNDDCDMMEKLCPGCTEAPVSAIRGLQESFNGKWFDESPMKKAAEVKLDNSRDKTPNNIQPSFLDENGVMKANTEEIFNQINTKMAEMFGEPYQTAMKNPKAKCNAIYDGGPEVICSTNPIES